MSYNKPYHFIDFENSFNRDKLESLKEGVQIDILVKSSIPGSGSVVAKGTLVKSIFLVELPVGLSEDDFMVDWENINDNLKKYR